MRREAALEILSHNRADLVERFGVASLALFGSVARDESGPESDVDMLVEFTPDAHIGLFGFVRLRRHLETVLGKRVDLATPDGLKSQFRDQILKEAIRAA